MTRTQKNPDGAIQVFEPDPDAVYTIEAAEHLAHVPRRLIAVFCKYRLVSSVVDPVNNGFYFHEEGIRTLRRIEYLHHTCDINLQGVRIILNLMNEVERLQAEARWLRQ